MTPHDSHLEKLLDAYFDGIMDETSRMDLEELVKSSTHARTMFWERASIEGALETWAEKSRGKSMAAQKPARLPSAWTHRLPMISGWAAAAALTLGWFMRPPQAPAIAPPIAAVKTSESPLKPPVDAVANMPVAYLSKVSGLSDDPRLLQGHSLEAGREIDIKDGLIEMDFYSGARISIQGPARFVPESDMRLTVHEGFIQVDVPDSAKGFVLTLPDGTVTDFGTSFDAEVSKAKTSRLQVSQGEIELAGTKEGGPAKKIFKGEAFSLADSAGSKPISFKPLVVKDSIKAQGIKDDQMRAAKWEKVCAEIALDPSVLVHFRFLPDEEGSREILNRASSPNAPRTGTVIAAEWTRGRWGGKSALAFQGSADRVRVDVPGEYSQVTYLAWVKVQGFPRRYNGLFLSESNIPGEAHWQFSTQGSFMWGIRPKVTRPDWSFHRAFSEPVLFPSDFGTWRLLATTYDAKNQEVIHYVDGREVHRSIIEDSVPIRFGRATLGNFFDPDPSEHAAVPGLGENWSFRNWCGSIDEFLLYSRVLSPEEISNLREAGSPD